MCVSGAFAALSLLGLVRVYLVALQQSGSVLCAVST